MMYTLKDMVILNITGKSLNNHTIVKPFKPKAYNISIQWILVLTAGLQDNCFILAIQSNHILSPTNIHSWQRTGKLANQKNYLKLLVKKKHAIFNIKYILELVWKSMPLIPTLRRQRMTTMSSSSAQSSRVLSQSKLHSKILSHIYMNIHIPLKRYLLTHFLFFTHLTQ